jgi:hypothetical protein
MRSNMVLYAGIGLVGLCAIGCGVAGEESPAAVEPATTNAAPLVATWKSKTVCVYQRGEWRFEVEYRAKGSRSEGQNGKLFKGDKPVEGNTVGELLDTSFGKMKYYGTERKVLWAPTGWNFADRRKMKRADKVPAKPSATKPGKACPCSAHRK